MSKAVLSESIQDYLKCVYKLQAEQGRVTIGAIAKEQSVSPASASAMVKKLAALGLLEHQPYPRRVAGAGAVPGRGPPRRGRACRAGGDPPSPPARAVPGGDTRRARRRRA